MCARISSMLVVLLGWICPAGAATLQISPVMVEMAPQQGASGIMLRNPDAMPVYGQVRVYAWEQRGGDDVLLPTDEIQVSPPSSRCGPAASSWCGWCARRGTGGDREELPAGHRRDSGSVHAGG